MIANSSKTPLFQQIGYALNTLRLYWLSDLLRRIAFKVVRCDYETYDTPSNLVGGYLGWYENKRLGCLAFQRDDNTIQFRW